MTESPYPILVAEEDDIEEARRLTYDVEPQHSPIEDDIEEARRLVYDLEPLPFMKLSSGGYVSFRTFQASDREQVQGLHEEWFPVRYKQEFYDDLVHQRMFNSGENLFTYAAVYHDDVAAQQIPSDDSGHAQSCSSACKSSQDNSENEDSIVACVVGSFVDVSRLDNTTTSLLISNPSRYTRLFYIMTLGTETEFRHARLATTLVKKCIDIVENDSQCGALYLHVITFNTAAIRFYERLGFYRVKEIEEYYKIDGKLYSCYLYARYFHGNRGHWDVYYVVGKLLSSVWQSFTKPLSMITYSQSRWADADDSRLAN